MDDELLALAEACVPYTLLYHFNDLSLSEQMILSFYIRCRNTDILKSEEDGWFKIENRAFAQKAIHLSGTRIVALSKKLADKGYIQYRYKQGSCCWYKLNADFINKRWNESIQDYFNVYVKDLVEVKE